MITISFTNDNKYMYFVKNTTERFPSGIFIFKFSNNQIATSKFSTLINLTHILNCKQIISQIPK